MPSVNLMSLMPFDKNKNIWMYFYKENILANLMANQVDTAVFSDEIPAVAHPALGGTIQDQRDFLQRVSKHEEGVIRLTEKLATAYAIVSRLVTTTETRGLMMQAEEGLAPNMPYRLRYVIRNILLLMQNKYSNKELSNNAQLIGKWNLFRCEELSVQKN